jgi:hypothetical protein
MESARKVTTVYISILSQKKSTEFFRWVPWVTKSKNTALITKEVSARMEWKDATSTIHLIMEKARAQKFAKIICSAFAQKVLIVIKPTLRI